MNKSFFCVLMLFCFLLSGRVVIGETIPPGINVLGKDSIAGIYIDLSSVYASTLKNLKEMEKTNKTTYDRLSNVIASLPPNNPLARLTVDAAIKRIEDLEKMFLPTGGLWVSITQSKQMRAVIEAKCDPELISKLIFELLSEIKNMQIRAAIKAKLDPELISELSGDIEPKMRNDTLKVAKAPILTNVMVDATNKMVTFSGFNLDDHLTVYFTEGMMTYNNTYGSATTLTVPIPSEAKLGYACVSSSHGISSVLWVPLTRTISGNIQLPAGSTVDVTTLDVSWDLSTETYPDASGSFDTTGEYNGLSVVTALFEDKNAANPTYANFLMALSLPGDTAPTTLNSKSTALALIWGGLGVQGLVAESDLSTARTLLDNLPEVTAMGDLLETKLAADPFILNKLLDADGGVKEINKVAIIAAAKFITDAIADGTLTSSKPSPSRAHRLRPLKETTIMLGEVDDIKVFLKSRGEVSMGNSSQLYLSVLIKKADGAIEKLPFRIEIRKTGIVIGSIPAQKPALDKIWSVFVNRAGKPGQNAIIEIGTSFIAKRLKMEPSATLNCTSNMHLLENAMVLYNMDAKVGEKMSSLSMDTLVNGGYMKNQPECLGGGKYSTDNKQISCSIHNKVKNIKNNENVVLKQSHSSKSKTLQEYALEIIRARMLFDQKALTVAVAVKSNKTRTYFKNQVEKLLDQAKQMTEFREVAGDIDTQAGVDILNKVKVFEKYPWIGAKYLGDEAEIISDIAIIAGAATSIAIPNLQNARDNLQKKICFSNQRVIRGATEMYNMDNNEILTKVDMEKLIAGLYLGGSVICPEGGNYTATGDLSKDGVIKYSLSIHVP